MRFRHSSQRVFGAEQLDPRLRHGLIGWWPGIPGSGRTLPDLSGSGRHGAFNGSLLWTLGHEGQRNALTFDGSASYISYTPPATAPAAFTLAAWAKTKTGGFTIVHSLGNGGGTWLGLLSNAWIFTVDGGGANKATYPVTLNRWTHVAATHDGTSGRLYVDGVLRGSFSGAASGLTNTARLGSWTGGGLVFSGQLDDSRLYARCLSAAEVALLGGAVPPVRPTGHRRAYTAPSTQVDMDALASTLVFGEPTVTLGALAVDMDALASGLVFGEPTVTASLARVTAGTTTGGPPSYTVTGGPAAYTVTGGPAAYTTQLYGV